MSRVDVLIAHIDRVLAECEASNLVELTRWQEEVVRAAYAVPDPALRIVEPGPRRPRPGIILGAVASEPIVDEVALFSRGACGNEAPRIVPGSQRVWCELAHGHPGWHQRGEQKWNRLGWWRRQVERARGWFR